MSEKISLNVTKRDETGRKIRAIQGRRTPGVIYGHKVKPQNLWIDSVELLAMYKAAGENTVLSLVGVGSKDANVLIHAIQTDPLSNEISHVDFFQVRMDEFVETTIPLVFVGVSDAVKTQGGTLTSMDVIPVRALPGDLPHEFTIDISCLATFEDRITIADLDVSEKVEILVEQETSLASVSAPRTQEEVDATDEEVNADVSQVEGVADAAPEGEEAEAASEEKK